MARYLFIVAHDQPELHSHLEREFSGEEGVEVVLDRRRQDRRERATPAAPLERRRADRRRHPPTDQALRSLNFALVCAE